MMSRDSGRNLVLVAMLAASATLSGCKNFRTKALTGVGGAAGQEGPGGTSGTGGTGGTGDPLDSGVGDAADSDSSSVVCNEGE